MAQDWSEVEVQAIVADYFAMLDCELRGQAYSKADHRRQLEALLNNRSKGSIEFKHQNISAILLELGLPYIDGYKPLPNYQALLKKAVEDWLAPSSRAVSLIDIAEEPTLQIPALPQEAQSVLVDIPAPLPAKEVSTTVPRERVARRIDYARREAANRSLGRQGEEFALQWETERLRQCGRADLAARVEWVSESQGDGLGYDIASFDPQTEAPIAIEVKTTRGGQYSPFFITRNELEVSREWGVGYRLYRLFRFAMEPKLFILTGALSDSATLVPVLFRGQPA